MVHSRQLLAAALGAGLASVAPPLYHRLALDVRLAVLPFAFSLVPWQQAPASAPYACPDDRGYRVEIVSLDPLLLYLHGFVSPEEAALVVRAGAAQLQPSPVSRQGRDGVSPARTSRSAPLPADDRAVDCVLRRAEAFLGSVLQRGRDDMGVAQLVHYTGGERFDLHHDWFRQPRITEADAAASRRRLYNRVATLFVVLQANCSGGETYFPQIAAAPRLGEAAGRTEDASGAKSAGGLGPGRAEGAGPQRPERPERPAEPNSRGGSTWRAHGDGGLAFRPVAGNALFWVNLLANGSGDARTLHAGLPVGAGSKTAMNIWPRTYFGPDA